jgi:hypothetical protein
VLIAGSIGWILSVILTKAGAFSDDPKSPEFYARTDARNEVIENTPWLVFPYPGMSSCFCNLNTPNTSNFVKSCFWSWYVCQNLGSHTIKKIIVCWKGILSWFFLVFKNIRILKNQLHYSNLVCLTLISLASLWDTRKYEAFSSSIGKLTIKLDST